MENVYFYEMEEWYSETHKTWNKVAQRYEEKFMDLELYNDSYQRFCDELSRPDASLLEIGCGPGNITRQLLKRNPKLNILATDVSKNMIDLAKKNNPGIEVQVLDGRNLKSIKNKFDGIISGFTIPYLSKSDSQKLLRDCTRLLNEEGVLYLSFVDGDYGQSGFVSGSSGDRTYFYYHQLETIKQTLEENNMNTVEVFKKAYQRSDENAEWHTILILKKI